MTSSNHENEDEILARIQEESLRYYNEVELPRIAAEKLQNQQHNKLKSDPQPESSTVNVSVVSLGTPVKELFYVSASQGAGGFHLATGDTYIYPTNYPVRKYQRNIIQSALFHNTLVSLPTGLGKTFIAAVVMFNYYRWFPQGKVVFMAPTRPLVAQQIRACHDIMAIPIKDTVEMTGTMNPVERTQQWKSKRVFFLTPQVMANDLRSGICPGKSFKCVVIDEAHKATGEYAYCHVIKELESARAVFRVLALSATPGSNIKAVIEVVQNLRITTLELRGEDSPDVVPYTHAKQVEPTILNLSKNINDFREQFLLIFERYARSLRQVRLITCNIQNISKFQLLKVGERLRSRPPNGMNKAKVGQMMADLMVCMSLAHGLELLQTYGLRAFYQYFTGCEDEENRKAAFTRLRQDVEFHQLMEVLNKATLAPMNVYWSHPKHEKLVSILLEHFNQDGKINSDSKVIIFCQYRVVVSEIHDLLMNIHPKIKPAMFIGQGVGKDKSGISQKKQIEIMKQFREGKSNVLIATCVAEEGLDIGAVDLLVLMEVQRSPVRLIQRLGRTGRHRKGRCVVLLTKGKEVQKFHEAMATRKSFLDTILNSKVLTGSLYRNEPVMFPPNLMPKIQLMHINVPERVTPGKSKKQSDIRQALIAKLSDTEEVVDESPYLSDAQAAAVLQELDTAKLDFDSISFTNSEYLFDKIDGPPMTAEKLFSAEFCKQSEYNEWNREPHQTYLLAHSRDTETLCHLLSRAEALQTGDVTGINSQVGYSQLMQNTKKAQKTKSKTVVDIESKKKKNDQGTKAGMDIRQCMAVAAEKVRLTQNLKKEETTMSEPIILDTILDLDVSIVQPCSDAIVEDDKLREHSDKHTDVKNSLSCSLCSDLVKKMSLLRREPPEVQGEPLTLLELDAVNNFVENLTKDIIQSINVGEMFGGEMAFSMENLKNSLAAMEESVSLMSPSNKTPYAKDFDLKVSTMHISPLKKEISTNMTAHKESVKLTKEKETNLEHFPRESTPDLFDVNDIFEEDPPFEIPTPNMCTQGQGKVESNSKKTELSHCSEDFFGIEDIFYEEGDMAMFVNLDKPNTKTSTPISKVKKNTSTSNLHSFKPSSDILENSTFSMHSTDKTDTKKNIFKVPHLKLNSETVKTPVVTRAYCPLKAPTVFSSPESPILSGQITQTSKQISSPKLERKMLFQEDNVNEHRDASISDISFFCKPLDKTDTLLNNDVVNNDLNISISQLFDDEDNNDFCNSKNESKNCAMDQSTMYTITQMVDKVSAINQNQNSLSNVNTKIKSGKTILNPSVKENNRNVSFSLDNKQTIDFGSSDEDSIFNNIDLDALDPLKLEDIKQPILSNSINQRAYENIDETITKSEIKGQVKNHTKSTVETTIQADNSRNEANTSSRLGNSTISSRWASCMKSPLTTSYFKQTTPSSATQLKTSTPNVHAINALSSVHSDSDSNSSVFLSPARNKSFVSEKAEKKMKKKQKGKGFVELEADVSGAPVSSDEENTSGLDELDASFINDMTQHPNTSVNQTTADIQARYLQSIKSPIRKPGGFKIPTMSDTVLGMDVFSQAVEEDDNDSYENDSFCCDDTEIPDLQDPSVLEIAEQILEQKKRKRKTRKKKKVVIKSDSSSDEISHENREIQCSRLLTSESSFENNSTDDSIKKNRKRRKLLTSESSGEDKVVKRKTESKKKPYLLTSESDSDVTDIELNH